MKFTEAQLEDAILEILEADGYSHMLGEVVPKPEEVFGSPSRSSGSSYLNLGESYPNLDHSSTNLNESRNKDGCLVSEHLNLPVIDDLALLSHELRTSLEALATEPRCKKRLNREILIVVILEICRGRFVTLRSLATLVNRQPDTLQGQYLSGLVRERKLLMAFPTTPTHERQAYSTAPVLTQETPKGTIA